MKKLFAFILIIISFSISGCSSNQEAVSQSAFMLDTVSTITLYQYPKDKDPNKLINECFSLCSEYEKMLSKTIETSDISKINSSDGNPIEVNNQTIELLMLSNEIYEASEGTFDITIAPLTSLWDFKSETPTLPDDSKIKEALTHVGIENIEIDGNTVTLKDPYSSIDLGGIAKGFIGDKAKEFLVENGVEKALISLGGNILVITDNQESLKIGIQKPFSLSGEYYGAIETFGNSVVTSGIYERSFELDSKLYHHILSTDTGYPVENDIASVTIIGPSSAYCDAYSTAVLCLGKEKGIELINSVPDYETVIYLKDGSTVFSKGINKSVQYRENIQ